MFYILFPGIIRSETKNFRRILMKKSVFILLCLALTLFAVGCVDDKKPDDHNSEQSTSDNLINSLPDISMPDKEACLSHQISPPKRTAIFASLYIIFDYK